MDLQDTRSCSPSIFLLRRAAVRRGPLSTRVEAREQCFTLHGPLAPADIHLVSRAQAAARSQRRRHDTDYSPRSRRTHRRCHRWVRRTALLRLSSLNIDPLDPIGERVPPRIPLLRTSRMRPRTDCQIDEAVKASRLPRRRLVVGRTIRSTPQHLKGPARARFNDSNQRSAGRRERSRELRRLQQPGNFVDMVCGGRASTWDAVRAG